MKRFANLWPSVVSFENLTQSAWRAYRANRKSMSANAFMERLEPEVLLLQQQLEDGSWIPGPFRIFQISDPKPRLISAAPFRDRVVHHALCAVIEPLFERRYIFDSYACRVDKGAHKAISRSQHFLKSAKFYLKADIKQYFQSVNHRVLGHVVRRVIKDNQVLALIDSLIAHCNSHSLNSEMEGDDIGKIGLSIGNLTSQHFANLYLDQLDHFIKEELCIAGYIRYMDDFVCYSRSCNHLHEVQYEIDNFLNSKLKLKLKDKATYISSASEGLPYLGFRVFKNTIRLQNKSRSRLFKKLRLREKQWSNGSIDNSFFLGATGSLIQHLSCGNTLALRQSVFCHNKGVLPRGL